MSASVLIASMMRPHGETGVQTHVHAVRDWLAGQGREVQLVTPFDCARALVYPVFGVRRLLEKLHQPASVWWYRHWHAVFLERALHRALADGRPCLVYAQCPLSARAALRARVATGQKVAMVVHFNLSQAEEWADKGAITRGGLLYRAICALESDVLPKLDGLVFVSDFMRRELVRRVPAIGQMRSAVIPNFLADPSEPVATDTWRDLITIGTLEYRKNQRYALEIVRAAGQMGHALTLTVVGDGPDRAMLEACAKEWGIADRVRFAGFVSNAAALMPEHRACLHVALMENLPLTLIEALSRGLPVFAPAAGGMPEVFRDGVEGRLIPLEDAAAAAEKITTWLKDVAEMKRAGEAARGYFMARFEADRVASELVRFLDGVANG